MVLDVVRQDENAPYVRAAGKANGDGAGAFPRTAQTFRISPPGAAPSEHAPW
jgi:hypothetical protein